MRAKVVASGTVEVVDGRGDEWSEKVDVYECELDDTDGTELTPEDVARRKARRQAEYVGVGPVDVIGVDIS